MANFIEKLKTRWNISSAFQVVIILVVFACTGFTVMFLKPVITSTLFGDEKPVWFTIAYWLLILPVYNIILLIYGFIFGQFPFFWEFEKRFFGRMIGRKRVERVEIEDKS